MMERKGADKPFAYVRIAAQRPLKEEFEPHHRFSGYTGEFTFNIKVNSSYLFVGSGGFDFKEEDKPFYSFFQSNGKYVIPGTSIKGAIRSILEAISNSCFHQKCKETELCPACRIFGTTGYGGRVSFSDAFLITSISPQIVKIGDLFPPRRPSLKKGERKFYQTRKFKTLKNLSPQRNYRFVEAFPQDSVFQFTLSFENLEEAEFSLLLYSLGLSGDFMPKIGGAKSRGFGSVAFEPINLILWENPLEEPEEISGENLANFISQRMKNKDLLNPQLFAQFAKGVEDRGEVAPQGVY